MDRAGEAETVPLREQGGQQTESSAAAGERNDGGAQGALQWVSVDGPLGVQQEEALKLARSYFFLGFLLLPWLWFVNCFYFWPVLRDRHSDPLVRPYIVRSAIGCTTVTIVLLSWALTFSIGGERVFGALWKHLSVYDLADKYSMSGA